MQQKCVFSGSGGQGTVLLAKLVCQASIASCLKVVMTQSYGIEQRGGDSTAYVIVSDDAVGNPLVESDGTIGVALSPSTYALCLEQMGGNGTLFYNSSLIKEKKDAGSLKQVAVPGSEMAIEASGSVRGLNLVMLGAMVADGVFLKPEVVESILKDSLGSKKPTLLESNLAAFKAGLNFKN